MKPYMQIVDRAGNVSYMHDADWANNNCDSVIGGTTPNEFQVTIIDTKGQRMEFDFMPKDTGRILSRTIASDTGSFVEAMCSSEELYELVEVHELFAKETGFDQTQIADFMNELFGMESTFFFRLTQQMDKKWILSFVFQGEEVRSIPAIWDDFVHQ